MKNNILAVAKNTFRETIRDRILLSGVFVIVGIILFTLFVGSISLGENTRIIINFSITAIYALQIFVAIFIGSMLIYKEIERKTFYLILPKPISRTEILIGKCLGLSATTILVTLSSTLVLLLILLLKGEYSYTLPILLSVALTSLEAILLILISIFFSTITSPILASVSTIAMFFIGHAGTIFKTIFMTTSSPSVEMITRAVYYILPNLEKFNIRNDIVYGGTPGLLIVLTTILYALAYATFILFVTQHIFKKKDF